MLGAPLAVPPTLLIRHARLKMRLGSHTGFARRLARNQRCERSTPMRLMVRDVRIKRSSSCNRVTRPPGEVACSLGAFQHPVERYYATFGTGRRCFLPCAPANPRSKPLSLRTLDCDRLLILDTSALWLPRYDLTLGSKERHRTLRSRAIMMPCDR